MIYSSFGIKLFFDRDLLLTENGELFHFGSGTRGKSTLDSPSNIYFYTYDKDVCIEKGDDNYISNVVELSKIPIYYGNNPKFGLWDEARKRKNLIENSDICIYFYSDDAKLKFFLHYSYKGKTYDRELNQSIVSLLKYTWFTSQQISLSSFELLGEKISSSIQQLNVTEIFKDFYIVSGEKTFYGRDSESTHYGERFIINTDDPYLIYLLLSISERLYPRSYIGSSTYMYGTPKDKEYKILSKSNIENEIYIHFLESFIENNLNEYDCRKCMKYIILRDRYLNFRPSHTLSIQCVSFDSECILTEKANIIRHNLLDSYSKEKHIGSYFYFIDKSVRVSQELMTPVIKGYLQWKFDEIKNSGLNHLTIYWSAKEICQEFNNRSNDRFNFKLDFSDFSRPNPLIWGDKSSVNDDDLDSFDWEAFENS